MKETSKNFYSHLDEPVPIDWLVFYRIAFGAVMLWYAYKNLITGTVDLFFTIPIYHFPYDGFRWVQIIDFPIKLGENVYEFIHLEYVCLGATSLLIMLGLMYRLAAILFAVTFAHIFLIDKCYYQNHYYLVTLLGMVLPFLPANRAFSIDALLFPEVRSQFVPRWSLWLMRFLIGVPYFLGGIAKIDADWLRGQPMRMSAAAKVDLPYVGGPWVEQEWVVQTLVWGGLLFDIFVVPGLLWRRTRIIAYLFALAFHLMNSFIWTIGIFPWLMMLATLVFFEPDWPRRLLARFHFIQYERKSPEQWAFPQGLKKYALRIALTTFVLWQSLFPFRHFVLPGNSHWDEYTHHFAWHMLLRAKKCGVRLYATSPSANSSGTIDLRSYVTSRQLGVIGRDPRMIHQLAHCVADDLRAKGIQDVEIRALALISLNGRKPQMVIDPEVDLASVPIDNSYPTYLMPLVEPFRHDHWDIPLAEWEQHLDLDLPPQMLLNAQVKHKQ